MHAITQHLHDGATVPRSDLVDQLGELEGDPRRHLVTGLLGQRRVAGEVREHAGFDKPRFPPVHSRVLERVLDMIEQVPRLEHLRMTPEEPAEQIFPGPTRPNANLPERRLECCVVPKATLAERFLGGDGEEDERPACPTDGDKAGTCSVRSNP